MSHLTVFLVSSIVFLKLTSRWAPIESVKIDDLGAEPELGAGDWSRSLEPELGAGSSWSRGFGVTV